MTLTVSNCISLMNQSVGAGSLSKVDPQMIVNQAGEHFFSFHEWKFLERRTERLDFRGSITLTGATWTDSSLTITKTGAFANYTWLQDDEVKITGGTGATAGYYRVASKTDSDNIVLESSIGSAADGQTDIAGVLDLPTVALPSDFSEVIGYDTTESLVKSLEFTTYQRLLELRTNQVVNTSFHYYVAIVNAQGSGNPPTPMLEMWPAPNSNEADAISIFYRAGWVERTNDNDKIEIPTWAEAAFIAFCREFARGYVEEDEAPLYARLDALQASALVQAVIDRDGSTQPDYGAIEGGAANMVRIWRDWGLSSTVTGP